jgi:hypothetical protein
MPLQLTTACVTRHRRNFSVPSASPVLLVVGSGVCRVSRLYGLLMTLHCHGVAVSLSAPVAARPEAWVLVAWTVGSNLLARGMDVCARLSVFCVGRGLCDGLIARPKEPYRMSK